MFYKHYWTCSQPIRHELRVVTLDMGPAKALVKRNPSSLRGWVITLSPYIYIRCVSFCQSQLSNSFGLGALFETGLLFQCWHRFSRLQITHTAGPLRFWPCCFQTIQISRQGVPVLSPPLLPYKSVFMKSSGCWNETWIFEALFADRSSHGLRISQNGLATIIPAASGSIQNWGLQSADW